MRIADVPSGNDGLRPDVPTLLSLMRQDKKVVGGKQTLILARGIGAAYITRDVPPGVLSDYLMRALA